MFKSLERSFAGQRLVEVRFSEAVFHSIYRGICDACKDLNLINKEFIAMRQQFEEQRQDRLVCTSASVPVFHKNFSLHFP